MNSYVPILEYHDVTEEAASRGAHSPYAMNMQAFLEQVEWLSLNGYRTLSLDVLADGRQHTKAVVLTFDDGDRSNHHIVFPILQKFGFTGTFFIIPGKVGEKNNETGQEYMTWSEIKEMNNHGMNIESHSMTHPYLFQLDSHAVYWELRTSKDKIEQNLATEVKHFSVPYGFYTGPVIEAARESCYHSIVTEDFGYYNTRRYPGTRPLVFPRITIKSGRSLRDFEGLIRHRSIIYGKFFIHDKILSMCKSILGYNAYISIRRFLFALLSRAGG